MAKKSNKRLSKYQASCLWELIGLFGYRHNHSSRRLLSNRGTSSKLSVGSHFSVKRLLPNHIGISKVVLDAKGREIPATAIIKPSVKELMEEEMRNEQSSHDSEFHNRYWPKKRSYSQSSDVEIKSRKAEPFKSQKQNPLDVIDIQLLVKEFGRIKMENGNGITNNIESSNAEGIGVEERLVAATKVFIEQRLREPNNGNENHNSKEFTDALLTLNSHKELFLKSICDPNSSLMKIIQNLDLYLEKEQKPGSSVCTRLSEEKLASDGLQNRKKYKLLGRRSKSLERFPPESDADLSSSSKVVFSKSGSTGLQRTDTVLNMTSQISQNSDKMTYKGSIFHICLAEIRKKFRNATSKGIHGITSDDLMRDGSFMLQSEHDIVDKGATAKNFGWSSPNKNYVHSKRFGESSKSGEPEGKLNESRQYPMLGMPDIDTKAKEYLPEMLKHEDTNVKLISTSQQPKPLGRILSLTEYSCSPCCSPRKLGNEMFITAQLNLFTSEIGKNVDGSSPENNIDLSILIGKNAEIQPLSPDEDVKHFSKSHGDDGKDNSELEENQRSSNCVTNPKDIHSSSILMDNGGMTERKSGEDGDVSGLSSESISNKIQIDIQFKEVNNEESSFECLEVSHCTFKPDLFGIERVLHSPTSSPERPSGTTGSDEAIGMNRPSPTSVLNPLFSNHDTSPESMFQLVVKQIQPRQIHFEEPYGPIDLRSSFSQEGEESVFEYVEAVLLGSGLNWEEFLSRWLCHSEILDPSLFDEVELFSSRSYNDQKLLFDYTNEVLKEMCAGFFGFYTEKSPVCCNIKGMDLIHEVYKRIECHLSQHQLHHSLDQLAKRDIIEHGKWPKIILDFIHVGLNLEEDIFDELVEDSVLDITNDNTTSGSHHLN